jgi:beta-glucuronidase
MFPLEDITFHLFDIISINKYYGWYEGRAEG